MEVHMVVTPGCVAINPWLTQLEPHLRLCRKKRVARPFETATGEVKTIIQKTVQKEPLFLTGGTEDPCGYVYPGLLEFTREHLEEMGHTVSITDTRPSPPQGDYSLLTKPLRPGQPDILQVMCAEHNGVIKAAAGLGKTETIVQYLNICPSLRVGIVTFKGEVRNSIYARIRDGAPARTPCMLAAGCKFFDTDVYVLVDKSLHRLPPEAIDVLLIDEVHGAAAEQALPKLETFLEKRIFGFSATPSGRSDKADLGVTALCGPVRVNLSYGFAEATGSVVPIHVFMYRSDGPTGLSSIGSDFIREKLGIWYNRPRNRLISQLARALEPKQQKLILCRSLEHVMLLRRLMPEAVCVFKKPAAGRRQELEDKALLPEGWSESPLFRTDVTNARVEFEERELSFVICTPVWGEGVDFPHLRWVIRADGLTNKIACIQTGSRTSRAIREPGCEEDEKPWAAVIDFFDDFDGMRHRSFLRRSHYEDEGWTFRFVKPDGSFTHSFD